MNKKYWAFGLRSIK